MASEVWVITYILLGLVTAAVVVHFAREVDWVTGSDSEVLFVGVPVFAIWPVIWGIVLVVGIVSLGKKLVSSE
jgi:hypothetical protein